MALCAAKVQQRVREPGRFGGSAPGGMIYRLLADEGSLLFPDDYFADLHKTSSLGRPTVRPARWPP